MAGGIFDANMASDGSVCYATSESGYKTVLYVYDANQNRIYRWLSARQYLPLCAVSPGAKLLAAVSPGQQDGIYVSNLHIFDTSSDEAGITAALRRLKPVPHRLELKNNGGVIVIDDAYNSNPEGAAEALRVLGSLQGRRRILITPGMVELGEREAEYNREFGREMAACVDIAIIVGKNRALPIIEGLKEAGFPEGNIHRVDSLDDSTRLLHSLVRPTDTVLYENDLPDHYQEA